MPSSRRTSRSGRATGRSGTGGEPSDERRSSRDSGRSSGRKPGDHTTLWIGLAGGAVVFLIILMIAFSGGRKKVAPKPPAPKPKPTVRVMRRDWHQVGFQKGRTWKYRTRNRPRPATREDVVMVAERMAVTQKNISKEGEKAFVKGFTEAAYGE